MAWPLFTRPGAFCEQQRLLVIFELLWVISIFNKALKGYYSTDLIFDRPIYLRIRAKGTGLYLLVVSMKIIFDFLCRRGSCLKVCVQMRNQLDAGGCYTCLAAPGRSK